MKGNRMSADGTSNKLWGSTVTKLRPNNRGHVHGLALLASEVGDAKCYDVDARNVMLKSNTVCQGCFHNDVMVGVVVVYMGHLAARVIDVMVHPDWRRIGVGSLLIRSVDGILRESQKFVEFYVPETNTEMHLFLKANEIRATEVLGDSYLFRADKGFSKRAGKQ